VKQPGWFRAFYKYVSPIPNLSSFSVMPRPRTQNLKLFVFIVGLDHPSPVVIEKSKTVGELKESIWEKNKNDLKDVDAR
jgi:Crinkler effector protein N-terminal domain